MQHNKSNMVEPPYIDTFELPIHFKTWSMQKEHMAAVEGVYFLNAEHDIAYESSHSQPVVDELAAAIEEHDMPTVFYTHTYESSPN
jgi:hypothetical protein